MRLSLWMVAAVAALGQNGSQRLDINDAMLRMHAFSLEAPAGWSMAGTMNQGSSCNVAVSPTYRVASSDGLTGVYFLPRLDWAWSADQRYPVGQGNDCMQWRNVDARQVLGYTIQVLKVGYVNDLDVPELPKIRASLAQLNARARGSMTFYADAARAHVAYEVNGRRIDESLTVLRTCNESVIMGPQIKQYQCSVFIRRSWAPAERFEQMQPAFRAIMDSETFDQNWNNAWETAMRNRVNGQYRAQTERILAQGQRAQAQRMIAHQEYMAVERRGADMRNQRFKEGQYVKQKVSDNRVDFLLDCQRFPDGTTTGNCPNRQTSSR